MWKHSSWKFTLTMLTISNTHNSRIKSLLNRLNHHIPINPHKIKTILFLPRTPAIPALFFCFPSQVRVEDRGAAGQLGGWFESAKDVTGKWVRSRGRWGRGEMGGKHGKIMGKPMVLGSLPWETCPIVKPLNVPNELGINQSMEGIGQGSYRTPVYFHGKIHGFMNPISHEILRLEDW